MTTIGQMTAEIRAVNIEKGWRSPDGGPGPNTLGDYIALLHTETAEAVEAFRDWRLDDATQPVALFQRGVLAKPEGVGSEMADLLIRLLDTGDVFGFTVHDQDFELGDVADLDPKDSDPNLPELVTFGDHMAWLARRTDRIWTRPASAPTALRALLTVCRKYGIDLDAEYQRKIAYNRTRPYRHGGRALADTGA